MSHQPLNYVRPDFDSIVEEFKQRLKNRGAWKDAYRSSTGQMLIEFVAYIGEMLTYFNERRANELFVGTARLNSSMLQLAKLMGYAPYRKVGARGYVKFYWNTGTLATAFSVPKFTAFQSSDGLTYVTLADTAIAAGSTTSPATLAVQGIRTVTEFRSNGTASQTYVLTNKAVENNTLVVTIVDDAGSNVWSQVGAFVRPFEVAHLFKEMPELKLQVIDDPRRSAVVDSFIGSTADSKIYTAELRPDGSLQINFGDGTFGAVPPDGAVIRVEYLETAGAAGNVFASDAFDDAKDFIRSAPAALGLRVKNEGPDGYPSAFIGGSEAEGIEELRGNIPRVFRSGWMAVRKQDFEALLEAYPGIKTASAWGEAEENAPNIAMLNTVRLVAVLDNYGLPDSAFKTLLGRYLRPRSQLTVRYDFLDAKILDVVPTLKLWVRRGYSLPDVASAVSTALAAEFVLGSTARLGVPTRLSDIYNVVEDTPGVDYAGVELRLSHQINNTTAATADFSSSSAGGLDVIRLPHGNLVANETTLTDGTNTVVGPGENDVATKSSAEVGKIYSATGIIDIDHASTFGNRVEVTASSYKHYVTVTDQPIGCSGADGKLVSTLLLNKNVSPTTVALSDGTNVVTDDGLGNLKKAGVTVGTITYSTGLIDITTAATFTALRFISANYIAAGTAYPNYDPRISPPGGGTGTIICFFGGGPAPMAPGSISFVGANSGVTYADRPSGPGQGTLWKKVDGVFVSEVSDSSVEYALNYPGTPYIGRVSPGSLCYVGDFTPGETVNASYSEQLSVTGEVFGGSNGAGQLTSASIRLLGVPVREKSGDYAITLTDGTNTVVDDGEGHLKKNGDTVGTIAASEVNGGLVTINTAGVFENNAAVTTSYQYVATETNVPVGITSYNGKLIGPVLAHVPAQPGSIRLTDGVNTVTDVDDGDGVGHFVKNGSELEGSSVNYTTGALEIPTGDAFQHSVPVSLSYRYYIGVTTNNFLSATAAMAVPVKPQTVGIYVGDTLIGIEDPTRYTRVAGRIYTGELMTMPGVTDYSLTGQNTINFNTGAISVTINGLSGTEIVTARYIQDSEMVDGIHKPGDIVPNNQQVVRLQAVVVTDLNYAENTQT